MKLCSSTFGAAAVGVLASLFTPTESCTNLLVTPGASVSNEAYISYNADSANLMGDLYHYPVPKSVSSEDVEDVYEWDTGRYLGSVSSSFPAPPKYNVVGNANSAGLVIGETTFGGHSSLLFGQPDSKMDYGSLIYWTLRRASNCRDAIETMAAVVDEFGYVSEGESFSLADRSGEVWVMEMMPRGKYGLGATWVAMRVPDGSVMAHANQARIRTFPRDDSENWMYAEDVVELARTSGLWNGTDESDFSFSDVYNPITFSGVRFGDARVYAMFSRLVDEEGAGPNGAFAKKYERYATALHLKEDGPAVDRMPLYVQPRTPLTMADVRSLMRDRYEGTVLRFDDDAGAGPYMTSFRPRPLTWSVPDEEGTYFNERAVGTQQTGWNFIAQVRMDVPDIMAVILWFGADDSSTSPRAPVYASAVKVSAAFYGKGTQQGVLSSVLDFDLTKAFWVQNMVSNLAYGRWNEIYPIVVKECELLAKRLESQLEETDEKIRNMLDNNISKELTGSIRGIEDDGLTQAVGMMSDFSTKFGDEVHSHWLKFYGQLFVQFRDGYSIVPDDKDKSCGCRTDSPGFNDAWRERIVTETGDRFRIPDGEDSDGNDHSDTGGGNDKPTVNHIKMGVGPGAVLDRVKLNMFDHLRNY